MELLAGGESIGNASMLAGMDRKTARKYRDAGALPSERPRERFWKTRQDPFAAHVGWLEAKLAAHPTLEAKTLFEWLCEEHPNTFEPGQVRTLQRRVTAWRALHGPERVAVLAQRHRPGEAAQLDFTHATELGITIAGVPFAHLLCVFVLPFSNWLWATLCRSESIAAITQGLQRALFALGGVPKFLQTDNSTAATHRISDANKTQQRARSICGPSSSRVRGSHTADAAPSEHTEEGLQGVPKGRAFNASYLALTQHFGLLPRTIGVGEKQQNGDVEASNGVLKRLLEQALLRRGHRDFEREEHYQQWMEELLRKRNLTLGEALEVERKQLRTLSSRPLPAYVEERVRVTEGSMLRVRGNAWSVPSRLIGETLLVRVYEERVEAFYQGVRQLCAERPRGRSQAVIDYRHLIDSLLRRPGAFARYVYREQFFPNLTFRQAFDALQQQHTGVKCDVEYLRILKLAATLSEHDVTTALQLLLEHKQPLSSDAVRRLVERQRTPTTPLMQPLRPSLEEYDALLQAVGT